MCIPSAFSFRVARHTKTQKIKITYGKLKSVQQYFDNTLKQNHSNQKMTPVWKLSVKLIFRTTKLFVIEGGKS